MTTTMTTKPTDLVTIPRSRGSVVWNFFGVKKSNWKGPSVCRLCAAEIPHNDQSSTSSMWQHLRNKHIDKLQNVDTVTTLSLKRKRSIIRTEDGESPKARRSKVARLNSDGIEEIKFGDPRWQKWSERLASFFYEGSSDLNENDLSLLKMMCSVDGPNQYEFPSLDYLIDMTIPALYEHTKKKVQRLVGGADHMTITTELSNNDTILVRMHYITDDWEEQSVLLGEVEQSVLLGEVEQKSAVSDLVTEVAFNQFNISPEKVVAIVTHDPHSNMTDLQTCIFMCFGSLLNSIRNNDTGKENLKSDDTNTKSNDNVKLHDTNAKQDTNTLLNTEAVEVIVEAICDTDDNSAGFIQPLLQTMKHLGSKVESADDKLTKVVEEIESNYKDREVHRIFNMASFVHPSYSEHSGVEFDSVRVEVNKLKANEPKKNSRKIFAFMKINQNENKLRKEYDNYTKESNGPVLPLEYWKSKAALYPNLAKLARKYLAIPALCGTNESVFRLGDVGNSCQHKHDDFKVTSKLTFLSANRDFV